MNRRLTPKTRFALFATALVFTISLQTPGTAAESEESRIESIEVLRARLLSFFVYFANDLDKVGFEAERSATESSFREKTLRTKIRMFRAMRGSVFQEMPQIAFVDAWSLLVRAKQYLATEEATAEWGEQTLAFSSFIEAKLVDIDEIATAFLTPEDKSKLESQIYEWTTRHPIEDLDWKTENEGNLQIPGVSWLLSIPMAPIKAMKGMDTTAQVAIQLRSTIELLSRSLFSLPLEVSWESELLILKAEESSSRLVDHVTIRLLQLVVLITIAIAALRLLWFFTRRNSPQKQ